MLLQLNAFLLRQGISPTRAISTASLSDTSFALWTNNRLEPLEVADSDLFDAAVAGEVIVALVRRPIAPPAWQQFIQDALALPNFGRASSALGAIVFCAMGDGTQASGPTRWLGWCFGLGWRLMRRRATDPRFGLLVALNALAPVSHPLPAASDPPLPSSRAPRLSDLQYRTTAPYFQQTGHRAARDIPVEGFRIDRASDLVSAVGAALPTRCFPRCLADGRCGSAPALSASLTSSSCRRSCKAAPARTVTSRPLAGWTTSRRWMMSRSSSSCASSSSP